MSIQSVEFGSAYVTSIVVCGSESDFISVLACLSLIFGKSHNVTGCLLTVKLGGNFSLNSFVRNILQNSRIY